MWDKKKCYDFIFASYDNIQISVFKNKRDKKREEELKISQGRERWQKRDYSQKCFLQQENIYMNLQEQNTPKC